MLSELLRDHAQARPDQPALVGGDLLLDWAGLRQATERIASGLIAAGIGSGDRVALLLPNCCEFVTGFLALMRVGAVAVPLAADSKPDEVRDAITATACRGLLADHGREPLARELIEAGLLDHLLSRDQLTAMMTTPMAPGDLEKWPLPSSDAAALEQFTSGTTGRPKRILRTHAQLAAEAAALASTIGSSPADRILAVVPLSHAHGLGNGLLAMLHCGGSLVLQERFDRRALLSLLQQQRITLFPVVPFMVTILAATRTPRPVDLSSLRLCFSAGSPLPPATVALARERWGIRLRQLYGSTETGAISIDLGDDAVPGDSGAAPILSVGLPLNGVELAIFDPSGERLSAGSQGRVAVRSAATATVVIDADGRRPLADTDGWIRTGDLGRLDDSGRLTLLGREALLINVAGRKVNPAEVEAVLTGQPQVREAVVVALRDPSGEQAVKAVVVPSGECSIASLLAACRERLADYKVPRQIELRAALPRCPAGKILRSQL